MDRRTFISLPLLAPAAALAAGSARDFHFPYDHVLGTSLDLTIRTASAADAQRAERGVLEEIARLSSILSTRNPDSEVSRMDGSPGIRRSGELHDVLSAYASWEIRTAGILSLHPEGPMTPRNVDALGKAYIVDRALAAAVTAAPAIEGAMLNIGGDIRTWGRPYDVGIADPNAPQDNGAPVTTVMLHDHAIATSGVYARGAHLIDGRTGRPALAAGSATVIARDAVTANALATTLSIAGPEEGLPLVEQTAGAEALWIGPGGAERRSSGFARFERPRVIRAAMQQGNWPAGFQVTVTFTLTGRRDAAARRHYLSMWVESQTGASLVKMLTVWGTQRDYLDDLPSFWRLTGGDAMTRATRAPGVYEIVWDGRDTAGKPVPTGTYRIVLETAQEFGNYAKRAAPIICGATPATGSLLKSVNFENVTIQYGPKPTQA